MIVRFTQVDYDRELALLALVADPSVPRASVVASRFVSRPTSKARNSRSWWWMPGTAAVSRVLMRALIASARKKGLQRLVGTVLRATKQRFASPWTGSDDDPTIATRWKSY
jgi:acetyltransferase